ncbi:hypothetical protein D3C87_1053070 [compost metagenome]
MKEAFLIGLGILGGFLLRGCSNENKRLKEDNALLMAELRKKAEAAKGGENK